VETYIRFSSDVEVSKCKAVFALASFHNSSAQFFKPAWCFNFSKLSLASRCHLTGLLLIAWKKFARVSNFRFFFTATAVPTVDYSEIMTCL